MTELTKLASWTTLERKKATEIDYRLDKDGDKEVDRDEFIVWWEWVVRNPQIVPLRKKATIEAILNDDRDALLQVFNTFDVDRGETLDRNEASEVVSCRFTSTPAVACCDFNPSLSERLLGVTDLRNLTKMEPLAPQRLAVEIEKMQKETPDTPHQRLSPGSRSPSPGAKGSASLVQFSQFFKWWKVREPEWSDEGGGGGLTRESTSSGAQVSRRQVREILILTSTHQSLTSTSPSLAQVKAWFTTAVGRPEPAEGTAAT